MSVKPVEAQSFRSIPDRRISPSHFLAKRGVRGRQLPAVPSLRKNKAKRSGKTSQGFDPGIAFDSPFKITEREGNHLSWRGDIELDFLPMPAGRTFI
jgi:hypothetical protein